MTVRHVFGTMGTVVSLTVDGAAGPGVLARVEGVFAAYDARFSLYRPESELSRIADSRLALMDASEQVRDAYERAVRWRTITRGAFTPHRPDGVIDLSGIVKALAIEEAGGVLDAGAGAGAWSIDCGGDILHRSAGPVAVGIADPAIAGALLTAIEVPAARRGVATSGVSERGEHVWGPRPDYDQVTVLAAGIVEADVLATAILAGGVETCDEMAAAIDCDVLALRRDGEVVATPGIRLATATAAR